MVNIGTRYNCRQIYKNIKYCLLIILLVILSINTAYANSKSNISCWKVYWYGVLPLQDLDKDRIYYPHVDHFYNINFTLNNVVGMQSFHNVIDYIASKYNDYEPPEYVGFLAERVIYLDGGRYMITLGSDDGSRLWIDGKLIIDLWGNHPYTEITKIINLTSGKHFFIIDYYNYVDNGEIKFKIKKIESGGKLIYDMRNHGFGMTNISWSYKYISNLNKNNNNIYNNKNSSSYWTLDWFGVYWDDNYWDENSRYYYSYDIIHSKELNFTYNITYDTIPPETDYLIIVDEITPDGEYYEYCVPPDYVGFVATKTANLSGGEYIITLGSKGASRLWIDDKLIIDLSNNNSNIVYGDKYIERNISITLSPGKHKFKIEYVIDYYDYYLTNGFIKFNIKKQINLIVQKLHEFEESVENNSSCYCINYTKIYPNGTCIIKLCSVANIISKCGCYGECIYSGMFTVPTNGYYRITWMFNVTANGNIKSSETLGSTAAASIVFMDFNIKRVCATKQYDVFNNITTLLYIVYPESLESGTLKSIINIIISKALEKELGRSCSIVFSLIPSITSESKSYYKNIVFQKTLRLDKGKYCWYFIPTAITASISLTGVGGIKSVCNLSVQLKDVKVELVNNTQNSLGLAPPKSLGENNTVIETSSQVLPPTPVVEVLKNNNINNTTTQQNYQLNKLNINNMYKYYVAPPISELDSILLCIIGVIIILIRKFNP